MSTAIEYFDPVSRLDGLDRLSLPDSGPELWDEVHTEIQNRLDALVTEVCRRVVGVCVNKGRTKGEGFYLFSYVTFSMPESSIDPVVIGMTITANDRDVRMEADVSGEEGGDIIVSVPSITVVHSRRDVLKAVSTMAVRLNQTAESVEAALRDPSRKLH